MRDDRTIIGTHCYALNSGELDECKTRLTGFISKYAPTQVAVSEWNVPIGWNVPDRFPQWRLDLFIQYMNFVRASTSTSAVFTELCAQGNDWCFTDMELLNLPDYSPNPIGQIFRNR